MLLGALLPALLAAVPAMAEQAQVDAGRRLFAEFCAQCHGADRRGLEAFGGDLAAFTGVLSGMTQGMPDFTDFFTGEEVAALYAYLATAK